ncbi:MAG: hypothetical protein F2667_00260 [Actinobacteria bacterium]|nr:hypothetical protein [Actinomycetota bacterium]
MYATTLTYVVMQDGSPPAQLGYGDPVPEGASAEHVESLAAAGVLTPEPPDPELDPDRVPDEPATGEAVSDEVAASDPDPGSEPVSEAVTSTEGVTDESTTPGPVPGPGGRRRTSSNG